MYLGEGRNPNKEHLLKLASKYQIKNAKEIIDEVRYGVNLWEKIAKEVDISKDRINNIKKMINF